MSRVVKVRRPSGAHPLLLYRPLAVHWARPTQHRPNLTQPSRCQLPLYHWMSLHVSWSLVISVTVTFQ